MLVTPFGSQIDASFEHLEKAEFPILSKLLPLANETLVKPEQLSKALGPRFFTPAGMVIDVNPEQSEKADCPMFVTLDGSEIDVSLEQPRNAADPMFVTPDGIVTESRPEGTATNIFPSFVTNKPFFVS